MSEIIVHVKTLEQWKSVLDVLFAQGYEWFSSKGYREDYFRNGSRQLHLNPINKITYSGNNLYSEDDCIEYADFMAKQKEDNKMETYYVTQEQLYLIEELKSLPAPLVAIMNKRYKIDTLYNELPLSDKEWLRYLGGDETIEFKLKEQLYRLWRIDSDSDKVYMRFSYLGTPSYTTEKDESFTAPLEEIKKWITPAWEIEEAN